VVQNDNEEPLAHTHFKAEGDVEFRAILYVPGTAPFDFYDNYYSKKVSSQAPLALPCRLAIS